MNHHLLLVPLAVAAAVLTACTTVSTPSPPPVPAAGTVVPHQAPEPLPALAREELATIPPSPSPSAAPSRTTSPHAAVGRPAAAAPRRRQSARTVRPLRAAPGRSTQRVQKPARRWVPVARRPAVPHYAPPRPAAPSGMRDVCRASKGVVAPDISDLCGRAFGR
ncbi:hypothetical protein [Streptomyces sp. NPDC047097]|uniref:hypothetical protein n=1 Tax=Streptomyces sp. NPDC047097 TaxID=3155260 RepID=UPI0033E25435